MATATLHSLVESSDTRNTRGLGSGPLLVATDASAAADAALRAAREIAARTRCEVSIVAVHEPAPIATPEVVVPATFAMDAKSRESLRVQVEQQLERLGIDERWALNVVTGRPASVIASVARKLDSPFVIMGLGGHGLLDRLVGDEMVLQVVRLGAVPVLGVAPGFSGFVVRALAAIDFSVSSARALELGAPLLRSGGTLTLAHVVTPDLDSADDAGATHKRSIARALNQIDAKVDDGVRVLNRVRSGDPATELLAISEDIGADLVITGSHGHNFLSRLLLGSVSTKLLRKARCSVLIAPPVEGPGFLEELRPTEQGRFMLTEWSERLEEFTRRNAGRRASLEVFDPEIGAQVEGKNVPFVGAAFDGHEARVYMMFGGDRAPHLTRSIRNVRAIRVLRDRRGKDLVLCVAHGRGLTLLTLER